MSSMGDMDGADDDYSPRQDTDFNPSPRIHPYDLTPNKVSKPPLRNTLNFQGLQQQRESSLTKIVNSDLENPLKLLNQTNQARKNKASGQYSLRPGYEVNNQVQTTGKKVEYFKRGNERKDDINFGFTNQKIQGFRGPNSYQKPSSTSKSVNFDLFSKKRRIVSPLPGLKSHHHSKGETQNLNTFTQPEQYSLNQGYGDQSSNQAGGGSAEKMSQPHFEQVSQFISPSLNEKSGDFSPSKLIPEEASQNSNTLGQFEEQKVTDIAKYSTLKNLLGKVHNLVKNYIQDDSQVENLEESLSLLALGEELCENKITELEQASQEEYQQLVSRFNAQFDRIKRLEEISLGSGAEPAKEY